MDPVPADRATRQWVRLRQVRVGNSEALVALMLSTSPGTILTRTKYLFGGIARIGVGALGAIRGRLSRNITREASSAKLLYRGLGHTVGSFGYAYHEYARDQKAIRKVSLSPRDEVA